MKKVWKKIIIVSLVLIILEAASFFVFILPYYRIYSIFKDIEEGSWSSVSEKYDALSDSMKSRVQDGLPDYAVYICEEYLDGSIGYKEAAASFDAINAIDETGTIMDSYLADISYNEYKELVRSMNLAGASYDNSTLYSMMDTLRSVQQRMQNEDRERALIELINEEYCAYLNEEITAEQMQTFSSTISGLSLYDAYNYTAVIMSNVSNVELYRSYYREALTYFDEQKYFDVLTICTSVNLDEKDTLYKGKFDELYAQAYDEGKTYYGTLLENYIASGDNVRAVSLMDSITQCYSDGFDLTDIKQRLASDWQLAYIEYIDNIDELLENDLNTFETGRYILENKYDSLKPDSLVLHDIDGDGVPEMFLYNSSQRDNEDYIGCFIYAYSGGRCSFLNYVNVRSFCRDSYLIGFPVSFGRSEGDEYSLVQYDGSSLTQISYCQEMGSTYYVNGTESSDVDYLSARTSILSHADAYNVGNSKGSNLSDGETYILTYQ